MKNPPKSLGPLGPVISKPKLEGGVLVGCTIVKDANHTAGHALWSTVRTIDAGQYSGAEYERVYRHRIMRALRDLTFNNGDDLVSWCTGKTQRPLERLAFHWVSTTEQARALANATALPKLRELELGLHANDDRRAIIDLVAAAKIERLRVDLWATAEIAALHAAAAAACLEIVDDLQLAVRYRFERGADGALSRLAIVADLPEKPRPDMTLNVARATFDVMIDKLEATLAALPRMTALAVTVKKEPLKKRANQQRLAALVKKFSP